PGRLEGRPAVLGELRPVGGADPVQRGEALDAPAERVDAEVAQLLQLLAALLFVKALRRVGYALGGGVGGLGLIHGWPGKKFDDDKGGRAKVKTQRTIRN